ncbi:hemin-degrading factor [Marinomonas sp. 2405UD68-3]|uniref:hemin-degrading factor n=1 Tax=Marinomonas sp. 2405UD68-3 TaxID=3391835 RepID=UPI0039C9A40D
MSLQEISSVESGKLNVENQQNLKKQLNLKKQWDELRAASPELRIRNAAEALGVSELELLLLSPIEHRVRLRTEVETILRRVETLGEVMALSRNDQAVHERTAEYKGLKVLGDAMGLYLGDMDLRLFLAHWVHVVAVFEPTAKDVRRSLQFFDAAGGAIHKIYATDTTDLAQWNALVSDMTSEDQAATVALSVIKEARFPNNGTDNSSDVRSRWSQLKDVHEFNDLLKTLQIDRLESLEKVGLEYAQPIALDSVEIALEKAKGIQLDIMVFVGNKGIVQIYTGPVNKLVRMKQWFNVLDAKFNLHLDTTQITSCWRVKRPSVDGVITSIDCFNAKRELIISLFGARKPGQKELSEWQALVAGLEAI